MKNDSLAFLYNPNSVCIFTHFGPHSQWALCMLGLMYVRSYVALGLMHDRSYVALGLMYVRSYVALGLMSVGLMSVGLMYVRSYVALGQMSLGLMRVGLMNVGLMSVGPEQDNQTCINFALKRCIYISKYKLPSKRKIHTYTCLNLIYYMYMFKRYQNLLSFQKLLKLVHLR